MDFTGKSQILSIVKTVPPGAFVQVDQVALFFWVRCMVGVVRASLRILFNLIKLQGDVACVTVAPVARAPVELSFHEKIDQIFWYCTGNPAMEQVGFIITVLRTNRIDSANCRGYSFKYVKPCVPFTTQTHISGVALILVSVLTAPMRNAVFVIASVSN